MLIVLLRVRQPALLQLALLEHSLCLRQAGLTSIASIAKGLTSIAPAFSCKPSDLPAMLALAAGLELDGVALSMIHEL